MSIKKVLLINPPIYDFAAYDFWMKPLGLLYLSNILKKKNYSVSLIDATYRQDPFFSDVKSDDSGRGKFYSKEVEKPPVLRNIPRKYKRYGLPRNVIRERIKDFSPDVVLVTCTMTYWYPGVIEVKEIINSLGEKPTLLLGGIYPTLLSEHAKSIGYDRIYCIGDNWIDELDITIPEDFDLFPPPDYSHYDTLEYAAITTSLGCPFRCPYCATPQLYREKKDKEIHQVIQEIEFLYKKGIHRFAFYDDALLIPEDRFIEFCYGLKEKGISATFYTPNGLHSRFLSKKVAEAMMDAGFREPRLSLETTDETLQKKLEFKTTYEEFLKAVDNLADAGYSKSHIYVYLLAGLPEQDQGSIIKSILDVGTIGVKISLAEFSPIPKTPMEQSVPDPLLTNNSAYYHYRGLDKEMEFVKHLTLCVNKRIDLNIPVGKLSDYL